MAHAVTSAIIASFIGSYFKSAGLAITSFACGILIDADHFLDYYLNHKFTLDMRLVYDACERTDFKKLYVLLHSYEPLIALWASVYIFGLPDIWLVAAIGFTQHIIFDQITNPVRGLAYFLSYRILKGFETESIMKANRGERLWRL